MNRGASADSRVACHGSAKARKADRDQPSTEVNVMDYCQHPGFAFAERPSRIDVQDINEFDKAYKQFREGTNRRRAREVLYQKMAEIFSSLLEQAQTQQETYFLSELQGESQRILREELAFYESVKAGQVAHLPPEFQSLADQLKSNRCLFGKLPTAELREICRLSREEVLRLRGNAENGKMTREDLTTNAGEVVASIRKVLSPIFESLGVSAAISEYMGKRYRVGGLSLEYSHHSSTWWRHTLSELSAPKTMYAHLDESIGIPKAIVYLSDVSDVHGPTSCYPGAYESLELNALKEIIGRIVGTVGNSPDSNLKHYYSKPYHQHMGSVLFRRHFMRLPAELRFNSHFGWDVVPGSKLEADLVKLEHTMLGAAGTFIAFDGARLLHRGGLMEEGERIVLQVFFSPPPGPVGLKTNLILLSRRVASKTQRILNLAGMRRKGMDRA